ncbi:MAG: HAMP domain-containing sensor histidine kinase [Bdellovibrionota bacterium]
MNPLLEEPASPGGALSWLIRLRWLAVGGQLATLLVAQYALGIQVPTLPILALIGGTAATNALLVLLRGRIPPEFPTAAAVLGFDTFLLTGLLYFSGGAANPFSIFYLVHVTLAAAMLSAAWTWVLGLLSMISFAALFRWHVPLGGEAFHEGMHGHGREFSVHLQGMWIAFSLAAGLIAFFVTKALRERDAQVAKARDLAARSDRLASLATLAAGAAHELGSPLATIALAAGELERSLSALSDSRFLEDARLIRAEVTRCRKILDSMGEEAASLPGELPVPVAADELVREALSDLPPADAARVSLEPFAPALLKLPRRAVRRALLSLLKNALEAAPAPSRVEVRAEAAQGHVRLVVEDKGCGMAPQVLARAGEPFFTTKEAGRGMGLGLFLARTVAERLGGALKLESEENRGTRAVLLLPLGR